VAAAALRDLAAAVADDGPAAAAEVVETAP
jgi:hypothetical protein